VRGPRRVVRQLVLVTSVVGLLTGAVGLAVANHLERRELIMQAGGAGVASAERTASVIDGRVDALLAQLSLLATREEVVALDDVTAELEVALRVTDQVERLVLHDASGRPVAAAAADRVLPPAEVAPREPVVAASAEHPTGRIDLDGGETDGPGVELTVPVVSPTEGIVGMLVGRADLSLVADEAARRPSIGGRTSLVSPDGRTFADRDEERVAAGFVQPIDALRGEPPVARVDGPEGPALLAAAPLRTLGAFVVVEQPERDVVGGGLRLFGPTGVLLAVVLAIVVAVIATARRLLRPLGPLVDGVGRLTAGERGVRVDEEGSGEVAELAQGFNRMAASLELRRRELERAERSARSSEERLRLVVEGVEGYAIVLLDVLGDVRSWNAGASRVTGYGEQEVVGRRLTDLAVPEEPIADPVLAATRTGRGEAEGWFVRPGGERYWGELTVTALRRDDGATTGYAAILQDVTERRAARRALEAALHREQQAADELRRANELKDEFLAVATHEIRTPLSAILGATQVLAPAPFPLPEAEAEEVRQMIWRHANDMHGIVERLMDFTQLQAGRVRIVPQRLALRREVERIVGSLGHELAGHEVVVEVAAVEVDLDPGFLHHVLSNLLSNAAKFSPAGSRLTVAGDVTSGELVLAVSDEGVGIAPEDRGRIFELFRQSTQTEASARGTGVGLTIVRRYVELVGGEVEVDSEPGEGATFTVRVPLEAAGAAPAATSRGSGTPVR
jgi:PAS domain S-box-containing protein